MQESLTVLKLQNMDGERVWCKNYNRYGIVQVECGGPYAGSPYFVYRDGGSKYFMHIDENNLEIYLNER